jgi:glucose/arabinose dehydrogenase
MKKSIYNIFRNMIFYGGKITSRQFPYEIQVIAENLYVPWAMAISDEGKLYFTERSGAIRVIEQGRLQMLPLITFDTPFVSQGEVGLMGLALDPNYSQNHYMYVMHSYAEGNGIYNRVVRLVENNNRASLNGILVDKMPGHPLVLPL